MRSLSELSRFALLLKDVILVLPQEVHEELRGSKRLRFKQAVQEALVVLTSLGLLGGGIFFAGGDMGDARDQGLRVGFNQMGSEGHEIIVGSYNFPTEGVGGYRHEKFRLGRDQTLYLFLNKLLNV